MLSSHKQARIVQIVTLDIQRRHVAGCSKFGTTQECPSASKKKCPYRLFGVGIDEHGERVKIRKALGTNNQQIASEELVQYRLNVEALNVPVASTAVTIENAMSKYFTEEAARGVSDTTLVSFHKFLDRRRDPTRFSPTLVMYAESKGITFLSELTADHIKEWRGQWKVAYKTSAKQWERVRQFFRYAEDAGWITESPAAKIKNLVSSRDDMPVTALSSAEVKAVVKACGDNEYLRAFLLTLLHSGLAIVDAVQLKPERLEGQHLRLHRTKTGKWVKVMIPPFLIERLNRLPVQEGGYWFWNRKGGESKHETATGNMRRMLRPIYRKSGVLLTDKQNNPVPMINRSTGKAKRDANGNVLYHIAHSHQWRHTFVHNHLKLGTPLEVVATLIGDTVKVVAATYAHFIEERQSMLDRHTQATWDQAS